MLDYGWGFGADFVAETEGEGVMVVEGYVHCCCGGLVWSDRVRLLGEGDCDAGFVEETENI